MSNNRYETPSAGTLDWHIPLNDNFERLDRDVAIRDVEANLSQYTPEDGAAFHARDTGNWFVADGSTWNRRNPPSGGGSTSESSVHDRIVTPGDDLAAVLNAARTNESVFVQTGTYQLSEHWVDLSDGVSVVGAPGVTIKAGQSSLGRRMITVNGRGHLRNLTVDAGGEDVHGIVVTGARSTVEHCTFQNTPHGYYPLNSYTANYTRFVNNEFIGNGDRGLAVTGAPSDGGPWNDFSLVANNIFRGNGEGPKIRGCRYCLFEGNTIHGDTDNSSNAAGILLQSIDEPNQHCLVTGNTVFAPDNPGGATFGVRVADDPHGDSRYNMVTNNVIYSQDYGILVRSPDTTVANNLITNGRPAVLVDKSGHRVNLVNNMIQNGGVKITTEEGIVVGNVARSSSLSGGAYVQGNFGF